MKADAIQVLKVASGKAPEAITIPNTLEDAADGRRVH